MPSLFLSIKFNEIQRQELAKALFNAGNVSFGALVLNQTVLGHLDIFVLTIGLFCFFSFFYSGILLLGTERRASK